MNDGRCLPYENLQTRKEKGLVNIVNLVMSDQYQGEGKGKQNTVDTQVQRVREVFLDDKQILARKKKKGEGIFQAVGIAYPMNSIKN